MQFTKNIKKVWNLFRDFYLYFRRGFHQRQLKLYLKSFSVLLIHHLNRFRHSLYTKGLEISHLSEDKIDALRRRVLGLHSLLPTHPLYTFSILLPVDQPNPQFLKLAIESLLHQTAPQMEILIGFEKAPEPSIEKILQKLEQENPKKIRRFVLAPDTEQFVVNELAKRASGHFLFLMGQDDWIRPDLLFRYEQTLRILPNPRSSVLYSNENKINGHGYFVPMSEKRKPPLLFPYYFESFDQRGLLIPKHLWDQIGGLRYPYKGAEFDDLLLRLELAGAAFQHVPIALYSYRSENLPRCLKKLLNALQDYTHEKKLDWEWNLGYGRHDVRAIPHPSPHHVQVVIPYKDQKELTLKCIHSILKQKDVALHITAVDNRSDDLTIGEEIAALGCEVIRINEPFNFSRLNNLAVTQSKASAPCELILFLNNDVELNCEALHEMVRWIDQPRIGMVGCRLHYPNGLLQHGGVRLQESLHHEMRWEHIEKMRPFEQMDITKKLGVMDAVTAACALIKKNLFLEIGGFDETWYPIGYSDTNLAIKLKRLGLVSFYTPYAFGIHHESVSRKDVIEDYENSWWLHNLLQEHQTTNCRIGNR